MNPVVIVTRPAAAGERLHRRLDAGGWNAVWCPAFDLGAAPDLQAARAVLHVLRRFDLVVFVSPNAVRASLPLVERPWPAEVAIGAVGEATATTVRAELALAPGTAVIAPAGDASGSEAFWAAWIDAGRVARRVLILRAQHGREWLAEQFSAAGAEVEVVPVYTRVDHSVDASTRAVLQQAMAERRLPVVVFSSSEAVDALDRQLSAQDGAATWLRDGWALATHERIRERLLDAGYKRIELTAADDEAVVARLESFRRSRFEPL
ncbi:MAG TPA: uroporphyrinogen-III synthase [Burkholderiaceae bacterium]|nr:uroporphyrinogen-III synthase [Burkholderiaceae bacterium]